MASKRKPAAKRAAKPKVPAKPTSVAKTKPVAKPKAKAAARPKPAARAAAQGKVAAKSKTAVRPKAEQRTPPTGAAAKTKPQPPAHAAPAPPARPAASGKGTAPTKAAAAGRAPGAPVSGAPAAPSAKSPKTGARAARAPATPPFGFQPGLFPGDVRVAEPLSRHTTFRIGGPAAILYSPANADALVAAVAWAKRAGVPWIVLGMGSNVLVRDGGMRGLVLKIGKGFDSVVERPGGWKVGAGLPTPLLARRTADAGLAGVHRMVGIPGTVGGGVAMNAGAHGQDWSKVIASVTALTPSGEVKELNRKAIPFSYRSGGLEGHVVLGATLRLEADDPVRLRGDLQFHLKRRRAGTPFDLPCAGSMFINPTEMTVGRLLDQLGLKGRRVGGAVISDRHANYFINRGGATADDVLKLIDIARTAVFKEYGIELELEIRVLGEPKA